MKCLAAVLLMFISALVLAQDVIFEGEPQQWEVLRVELAQKEVFSCPRSEAIFQNADFNQDGVLDDFCVGLKYDPCDIQDYQIQLSKWGWLGFCKSAAQVKAKKAKIKACNSGFSPTPAGCN